MGGVGLQRGAQGVAWCASRVRRMVLPVPPGRRRRPWLTRQVIAHGYAWPWMVLYVLVRWAQIAGVLFLLVLVLRWGFA